MSFRAGEIVWVLMADSNPKGPVKRPALIVDVYGIDCLVMAITSSFNKHHLAPHEIPLPRNDVTNLKKESVVSCNWREVVLLERLEPMGSVEAVVLARARYLLKSWRP
jgi:hypothetical protein